MAHDDNDFNVWMFTLSTGPNEQSIAHKKVFLLYVPTLYATGATPLWVNESRLAKTSYLSVVLNINV